jgi:hypothetical protein
MTAGAPPPSPRALGLPLLLLVAVGVGVVAALLVDPITTEAAPVPSPPLTGSWVATAASVGVLVFLIGVIGLNVARVAVEGRMRLPTRTLIVILVVIGLLALFVLFSHLAPGSGTPSPGGNGTNASGPGGYVPPPHGGGSLAPPGSGPVPAASWLSWALLGAIVLWFYGSPGRAGRGTEDGAGRERAARLRGELEQSLRALEDDPEADPRRVIQALYHRLLLATEPYVAQVEVSTPREIGAALEGEIGASPRHAEEMTRLFEEARYSSHPMDRRAADRARAALRGLLEDIDGYLGRRRPRPMSSSVVEG